MLTTYISVSIVTIALKFNHRFLLKIMKTPNNFILNLLQQLSFLYEHAANVKITTHYMDIIATYPSLLCNFLHFQFPPLPIDLNSPKQKWNSSNGWPQAIFSGAGRKLAIDFHYDHKEIVIDMIWFNLQFHVLCQTCTENS